MFMMYLGLFNYKRGDFVLIYYHLLTVIVPVKYLNVLKLTKSTKNYFFNLEKYIWG